MRSVDALLAVLPRRAPKGRSNKARLNAWVSKPPSNPSPEGAGQSFPIPYVPLVVGDSVRVQQLLEFLLKAGHTAVAFLLCYVERGKRLRDGGTPISPLQGWG
jgi:hypothetical protein